MLLDISKISFESKLNSRVFARKSKLRLLRIYNSGVKNNWKVHLPHGWRQLPFLGDEISALGWIIVLTFEIFAFLFLSGETKQESYRFKICQPQQLWAPFHARFFQRLEINLERLNSQYCCTSFIWSKVISPIQYRDKLIDLDPKNCTSLISLPSRICSRFPIS